MLQYRIGRIVGTTVLALSALATTGCLGDSDPVQFEVSDEDVMGVAIVISQQHQLIAGLADESTNENVLALSDSIAAHHAAQLAALDEIDIGARASNITQFLSQQTTQINNGLAVLTGEQFDMEYVDVLVQLHDQNIGFIDDDLLPNVESAALEAELNALRAVLVADLVEVETLQEEVGTPAT